MSGMEGILNDGLIDLLGEIYTHRQIWVTKKISRIFSESAFQVAGARFNNDPQVRAPCISSDFDDTTQDLVCEFELN